ncbi:MAG: LysR substrate-binding domain-containing protein [Alphaproteobacteria bacterium]|nr:LysR substrate-binding domain-containing protein [Alphaproteobacteria bacterium]
MITLRQIEAFRAIMMSGSVTQAGNLLFVSQPAISRMLSELERAVGFKLFTRANRVLKPTEEGLALYEEVDRAFIGLGQIEQAAASIRQYHRGNFRLITINSLASTIMADLVARFSEHYPDIAISLEVRPSQRVFDWIVSQHCDMGLSMTPTDSASVVTRQIAKTRAVCIMPRSHVLTGRDVIQPVDLAGLPFISFTRDAAFRRQVDDIFSQAGVTRDMKLETRTAEGIFGLVSAGLGVSIVGQLFSDDSLPANLTFRPFRPVIEEELLLIYSAAKPLSRLSTKFIEVIDEYVGPEGRMRDRIGFQPTG